MAYNYFDSRLSKKMRQRRKQADTRSVLTVSILTNRIYFSCRIFERFDLGRRRVSLVQDIESPTKIYLYCDDDNGFELTVHQYCYYVNSKKTVIEITQGFDVDIDVFEFEVANASVQIEEKEMYQLSILPPSKK